MEMDRSTVKILVVDDDALSLELIGLLLVREGYEVTTADSGDAALVHLRAPKDGWPRVVLADLQMPGVAGGELFRQLRRVCGSGTVLLAMSGGEMEESLRPEVDGFLRKPFTMKALAAAINTSTSEAGDEKASDNLPADLPDDLADDLPAGGIDLDADVYTKLASSMAGTKLAQLYALCLNDAKTRVAVMRRAASEGDDGTYRKQAHAIRGGCGMVGALELHTRAVSMEERGLMDANHVASLDEFLSACERLRRILVARVSGENATYLSGEDTR